MSKHSSNGAMSRRKFVFLSAAASSAALIAPKAFSKLKPKRQSANEKLNIAVIGSGGRGAANLAGVSSENIVALCDLNENNLNEAAAKHPSAKKFIDFRELFDKAANDFDAVVISTTEHTHAFVTMQAIKLGKHVYCEKPLTHSVWEARMISEAAKKAGVATQMGTQIHAGNNYRRVVELVQSGAIGKVKEAHVWVSRAWGGGDRPKPEPAPSYLHWDLWLGPAPERPFSSEYIVPHGTPRWYKFWDFGGGTMSDLGAHYNDLAFWALKLDHPLTIEAFGPPPSLETAPATMHVHYEYGARGELPPVSLTWYQGEDKPQIWKDGKIPQWDSGHLFIGDKGMLLCDYGKHVLLPEKDFKDFQTPKPFIPDSIGHYEEWILACKTGSPTTCFFDYAGALTEANHLGNVAHRVGKKLEWDAKNLKVKNAPEAAHIIHREYRKGWKLV
ncbi:MAG: iolG 18 [Verrucomicrobiales bacterium]|nr:iolG 18 [Verrucomicrobiales bacterium]